MTHTPEQAALLALLDRVEMLEAALRHEIKARAVLERDVAALRDLVPVALRGEQLAHDLLRLSNLPKRVDHLEWAARRRLIGRDAA